MRFFPSLDNSNDLSDLEGCDMKMQRNKVPRKLVFRANKDCYIFKLETLPEILQRRIQFYSAWIGSQSRAIL